MDDSALLERMPCGMFGFIGNASAPLPAALVCRQGQDGLIVSFQRMRVRGRSLGFPGMLFFTSTGFAASAGSVRTADALPKPSRSAAMRWASSVMACMSSRLTSPPFTASPICAAVDRCSNASPPPPARLFFLPDAAQAWREEVDCTTARRVGCYEVPFESTDVAGDNHFQIIEFAIGNPVEKSLYPATDILFTSSRHGVPRIWPAAYVTRSSR